MFWTIRLWCAGFGAEETWLEDQVPALSCKALCKSFNTFIKKKKNEDNDTYPDVKSKGSYKYCVPNIVPCIQNAIDGQ